MIGKLKISISFTLIIKNNDASFFTCYNVSQSNKRVPFVKFHLGFWRCIRIQARISGYNSAPQSPWVRKLATVMALTRKGYKFRRVGKFLCPIFVKKCTFTFIGPPVNQTLDLSGQMGSYVLFSASIIQNNYIRLL